MSDSTIIVNVAVVLTALIAATGSTDMLASNSSSSSIVVATESRQYRHAFYHNHILSSVYCYSPF
jgi:hypothetical protein